MLLLSVLTNHEGTHNTHQEKHVANQRATTQAQAQAVSGLIGIRDLALLESHYRVKTAEYRAERAGGMSSANPGDDRRYR